MASEILFQSWLNLSLASLLSRSAEAARACRFGSADASRDAGLLTSKSSDRICSRASR